MQASSTKKYGLNILKKYKFSVYYIISMVIRIILEGINDEHDVLDVPLTQLDESVTESAAFLDSIKDWLGIENDDVGLTKDEWIEYESKRFQHKLRLQLIYEYNNEMSEIVNIVSTYPGQLGQWVSQLTASIDKDRENKGLPPMVCVSCISYTIV